MHKMKKLYIRIVKTGSTSLSSAFDKHVIEVAPSIKYRRVFRKYRYDYRFAFIRNPYDRIVSAYNMLTRSTVARDFYTTIVKNVILGIPFDSFLKKVIEYRNSYREFGLEKENNIHLCPWRKTRAIKRNRLGYEVYWILAHTESLIDSIEFFTPVDEVDYIGRFETLRSDFEHIRKHVGTKKELPLLNVSANRGKYSEYYDDESLELVTEIYRKDIETFKYEFL